jgi:hypothetical protein
VVPRRTLAELLEPASLAMSLLTRTRWSNKCVDILLIDKDGDEEASSGLSLVEDWGCKNTKRLTRMSF